MTFRPVLAAAALLALAACAQEAAPVVAPAPAPAPQAQAPAPAPAERPRALPIFFEPWSADIGPQAQAALDEAAERVRAAPNARLLVVGYASPRGSGEANALLSQLRARKVYDALVAAGVPAAKLRRTSRGPTPGMEDLESRRVEVRVDEAAPARRR
ncbi:OmpA family protein [Roseococcus sp. DSY-14]|uniref:OmpA family protein n=1 Tax=Roseococcus sp. DSY-14 TaxID=3369650 RepID=UPI00387B43B9